MKKINITKISSIMLFIMILLLFSCNPTNAIVYQDEYGEQFTFSQNTNLAQVQYQDYNVKYGDSLYKIAKKFGVSILELRKVNNIWDNQLIQGQILRIPTDSKHITYQVKWGDSLYKISQKHNVSVRELRQLNKLNSDYLWPGQNIIVPSDLNKSNSPTIVIDAGHGGRDPGAINYYNSRLVKESEIVYDISNRLSSILQQNGYNVIVTRTGDYKVPLRQRVSKAYQHNADLFVSIHADSNPNYPYTSGSNVYIGSYADWNTYKLADSVQKNLERITGRPTNNLGRVLRQPFTVIMQSRPAILVETGFLSNWSDLSRFQSAAFRQQLAQGIFYGINQWVN